MSVEGVGPASELISRSKGESYLENLRAEGLLMPILLKIYVAGVVFGRATDRIFDAAYLTSLGISNREFESLITLHVWGPKYRKPGALAEFLGMSASGMTAMIDRLEALGLVERGLDPEDGRVRLVHPTQRGLTIADAGLRIQLGWMNETIGEALTPAQELMLSELLQQVLLKIDPGYEVPPVDL